MVLFTVNQPLESGPNTLLYTAPWLPWPGKFSKKNLQISTMIYHDLPISSHRMAKQRWTCCQKQPDHSLCFSAHQTYSKAYIQPATGLVQPECSKSISKFKRVRHPCLLHDLNLNYPGMCQMVSNPINSASEKYTCALERKGLITNYTLLHT